MHRYVRSLNCPTSSLTSKGQCLFSFLNVNRFEKKSLFTILEEALERGMVPDPSLTGTNPVFICWWVMHPTLARKQTRETNPHGIFITHNEVLPSRAMRSFQWHSAQRGHCMGPFAFSKATLASAWLEMWEKWISGEQVGEPAADQLELEKWLCQSGGEKFWGLVTIWNIRTPRQSSLQRGNSDVASCPPCWGSDQALPTWTMGRKAGGI